MELSFFQYSLVYNTLSLTIAVMLAAGVYFVATLQQVNSEFRPALVVSALVVFIAAYHYFRIFNSWTGAFELTGGAGGMARAGQYVPGEGEPFNEAYRYADWLVTVPLLLVEMVMVLDRRRSGGLLTKLVVATVLMLGLGYIGEVQTSTTPRLVWGTLSTLPFVYIVAKVWNLLSEERRQHSGEVAELAGNMRYLLLLAWGWYPIVYLFPVLGLTGANTAVSLQIGYSIADIVAKAGWGLMIHAVAVEKSSVDAAKATAAA